MFIQFILCPAQKHTSNTMKAQIMIITVSLKIYTFDNFPIENAKIPTNTQLNIPPNTAKM